MGQQGCVLIAEDEADIRGLISTVLEDADYPVRETRDGNEALALSRLERPVAALRTT